jgi:hypothetical protein
MKEQILHLDPHDDYISARDKMGWVQTQRVLIVWPPRGRVLTRRLDLVLLHRHAHRLGAQVALITPDTDVREHALELGLPVFNSIDATRRERWRSHLPIIRPERRQPRPDTDAIRTALFAQRQPRLSPGLRLALRLLFLAIGLFALGALAYALIPSATITLTLANQPVSVTVELAADPNPAATVIPPAAAGPKGNPQSLIPIPARTVRVEVEASGVTPTTGSTDVPGDPATGKVVFTNIIGTPALIPAGTSVRTTTGSGVRFTTLKAVNIEGRISAVVEADVKAVEPGPSGNVAASLINAIDGPLGLQLAVTNPLSMTGGTVTTRAAVAQADRARVRAQALAQAQANAQSAIEAQLQPGEFLATGTLTLTQTLAEVYSHGVGETTDLLTMTVRTVSTALAIREADAQTAARAALAAQVPATAALTDSPIQFRRDPALTVDESGRVHFMIAAEGQAVPHIDREMVRRLVAHQSLARAAQQLQSALPLAAPPEINLSPGFLARWYPYLPWMLFRISVIVNE